MDAKKQTVLPTDAGYQIFGCDAAESDQNLSEYFIETSSYTKVLAGRTLLVLGRKGSGKSAIFKMLSTKSVPNLTVIPITPKLFALDVLNAFITKYPASPFNRELAYSCAWRYSLLLELLLSIENRFGALKIGAEANIHSWLRKNVVFNTDIISRTVAFLEQWTVNKVSFGQLAAAVSQVDLREPLVGQDIETTIPDIRSILNKHRFLITIDNLDEGWVNTTEARAYLAGLVLASRELSLIHNLSITIFMRTDVFRVLESSYQHMDKFRESIEYILWNPTSLSRLIALRIQRYFQVNGESNMHSWKRLFPPKMPNSFYTLNHIIERTFLRPREVIQFCRLIIDNAVKYKKVKSDYRDIQQAESQYSDWKLSDLSGEYSAYYNRIDTFLYCFRRVDPQMTRKELEEVIKIALKQSGFSPIDNKNIELTPNEIISLLYSMGFLRALYPKIGRGYSYIASSSEPNLICNDIEFWDIHPAFRSKLIIKPR
jgi:energy-coupling factor transporter ATP-binding protein EcfA2